MGIENVGLSLHLGPEGRRFLLTRLSGTALGCGLPIAAWLLTRSFWISAEVYVAVLVPLYIVGHFWLWVSFWILIRHGRQGLKNSKLNDRAGAMRMGFYLGYIYAPIVLLGIYLVIAVLVALP